mgnify:CR=1 FL=1
MDPARLIGVRMRTAAGCAIVFLGAADTKPVARTRVDVILGGCALREVYEQSDGLVGRSFTIYDAARKLWHQTWVTNRGSLLAIEGTFEDDGLTLQGSQRSRDGKAEPLRGRRPGRFPGRQSIE